MARIPRQLARLGASSDLANRAQFDAYVGPDGELTIDNEEKDVRLHNGSRPGGFPLLRWRVQNARAWGVEPGAANAAPALNALINRLFALGGGEIYIPPGAYTIATPILPKPGVRLRGAGIGITILKTTSDHIISKPSNTVERGFEFSDMTFDCNGLNVGIAMRYVEQVAVRRCKFINGHVWMIAFADIANSDTNNTMNSKDLLVEDCIFDGDTQTYEQILIGNCQRVTVKDCKFRNNPNGIGVGIWQYAQTIRVVDCDFDDVKRGVYYSLTTNDIRIRGCDFRGGTIGVQGGNEPDYGVGPYTHVLKLTVDDCEFAGMSTGLEIGAVKMGKVSKCHFERVLDNAIVIDKGNVPGLNSSCAYIAISDSTFKENNAGIANGAAAALYAIHPGILVTTSVASLEIVGCHFFDEQGTKKQYHPITFSGSIAVDGVTVVASLLAAYGSGTSITVRDGATVTNGKLYGCQGVTGALPAGFTAV